MNKNIRTESYWNKQQCFSCRKAVGENEYRHTWSEEFYDKTGGKEERTYYCPCGEKISIRESIEANKEQKKINEKKLQGNSKENSYSLGNKGKGDEVGFYMGSGIVGISLILLSIFIFVRIRERKKY